VIPSTFLYNCVLEGFWLWTSPPFFDHPVFFPKPWGGLLEFGGEGHVRFPQSLFFFDFFCSEGRVGKGGFVWFLLFNPPLDSFFFVGIGLFPPGIPALRFQTFHLEWLVSLKKKGMEEVRALRPTNRPFFIFAGSFQSRHPITWAIGGVFLGRVPPGGFSTFCQILWSVTSFCLLPDPISVPNAHSWAVLVSLVMDPRLFLCALVPGWPQTLFCSDPTSFSFRGPPKKICQRFLFLFLFLFVSNSGCTPPSSYRIFFFFPWFAGFRKLN